MTTRERIARGISSQYSFYFDKGVPVYGWPDGKEPQSFKWRRSVRRVMAYSLRDAIEKLCKPLVQKHGLALKLNVYRCIRNDANDISEINLDAMTIEAFLIGSLYRDNFKSVSE